MFKTKTGPIPVLKNHTARFKTMPDQPRGTFEAMVSVYGNTDLHGDIVAAGAFDETIKAWKDRGKPTPLVWSHQYTEVDSIIGEITGLTSTDKGLKIDGRFHLDQPKAARVHDLMEKGIITEFSWSGEVLEYELIEKDEDADEDEDDIWAWLFPGIKIQKVDLWEAGPCFKGANPDTELLSIKHRDPGTLAHAMKIAGAIRAAQKTETLTPEHREALNEARNTITEILAATEQDDDDEDTEDEGTEDDSGTDADKTAQPDWSKVRALLELTATI